MLSGFKSKKIWLIILLFFPAAAFSQVKGDANSNGTNLKALTTSVNFLMIAPDSRSGAMGDAGVALSPDVNANFWNPSKLVFNENKTDLSMTYSPWLRKLIPDVNLGYVSFSHKLDNRNTIGASLRYFNLGTIELIDDNQTSNGTYRPNEFALDVSLARKFGDDFSLGLTARYIHSSLSNGAFSVGQQTKAGNALAADVSMYYRKPTQQFGKDALFAFGAHISNIGTKISYTDAGQKQFLPANLRIGAANTWYLDDLNELTFALDINKLLVPTPPVRDADGNIVRGKDDNRSVPAGIFGSFSDAPGGFGEEMKEISYSPGVEYWYNKQFALRAGYLYENPEKGDRHYLTLGIGLRYNDFDFDFSYLAASQQRSPLANTLRFTIGINFGADRNKK
jgi:hypothetical protein